MKLTKTVKYNYKLTEETLEKDIDKFIEEAKKGNYHMDKMYENEGLKMIKQYFRILNEKFKNNELEECKKCYHKLIPFLLIASTWDTNLFDYNDLLAKINSDFDYYIKNYFICLVKTCNIDKLAEKVSEYASSLDIYRFDSDTEVLFENLDKEMLDKLEEKMLARTQGMTNKDIKKHRIIYFLMNISNEKQDKEKYLRLCERFRGILNSKEFEYLKEEYEENQILPEKIEKKIDELITKKMAQDDEKQIKQTSKKEVS